MWPISLSTRKTAAGLSAWAEADRLGRQARPELQRHRLWQDLYWNHKVGLTSLTDESFEDCDSLGQVFDTLFRVEERAGVSFQAKPQPAVFPRREFLPEQEHVRRRLDAGATDLSEHLFLLRPFL